MNPPDNYNQTIVNFLGIIPARYRSTRLPGKPMAMIGGKSVIQRVYESGSIVFPELYVATDDQRIFDHVRGFGGNVVMTSPNHTSGTDRCREAMDTIVAGTGFVPDVVVNIQGDEPFIRPEPLSLLKDCFEDEETQIATLARKMERGEDVFDENVVKVVLDHRQFALYFSRAPIPFVRGQKPEQWWELDSHHRHLGIYAYRRETLRQITGMDMSSLESAEMLEQLRWLQAGYRIKLAVTTYDSMGIDTPEDLQRAERFFNERKA